MKLTLASVIGLLGMGAVVAAPIPGPPRALTPPGNVVSATRAGARAVPIEDLFKSAQSDSAVWSSDGRSILYTSNQSGRANIWSQPLSGANATQLTRSESHESVQAVTPDGRWIIFQADREGRELNDLYRVPSSGGEPQNLTATEEVNESSPIVSHDGKLMAFLSREKSGGSNNVAVMELATRSTRLLTHEAGEGLQWEIVAISHDGRFIIANRHDWNLGFGEVYRIDVADAKATRLTEEGVYAEAGDLSSDGRYVSLSVESSEGTLQAMLLDLTSSRMQRLAMSPWEQKPGHFSPDGRTLLVLSNIDGQDHVFAYDLRKSSLRELPVPLGVHINNLYINRLPAFSPDGKRILFPQSSGSQPDDYWIYELGSRQAQRVTRMAAIETQSLPATQIVHYESFDGTVISALLWVPYNLKRDGRAAGVVLPHGGPTARVYDIFNRTATALASRGYVVIAPNFRGSTGYGRAFLDANRKDLGGGDLKDVVAGARFLVETGFVDARKVGISGGSYGGFMTLMALGKTPDVWAAGVEQFGIVNWRTMWEHSAAQNRGYQKSLVGDPQDDAALYERLSPLTYLGETRAPLLVLHGENDIRVPIVEAHQVVELLQKRGRVVESHFYPGEGHGFTRRENQIDALERTVEWFDRYLKGRDADGAAPGALQTGSLLEPAVAAGFAGLALSCLQREYPNKIAHVMDSDADALAPRRLTPAFYGCFDWHSAVHGHWLLVRLVRLYPDAPFAAAARAALARSLAPENIAGEIAYLKRPDRASFERPYGLAWLLQLAAELRQWNDPEAQRWSLALQPLETEAALRLKSWLPKLHYPIRVGEHDQTAFSFALMWDWAMVADDAQMRALLSDAAGRFYQHDRNCPLNYEPSGQDFLSPCLAEADFMRRVLDARGFRQWLTEFLPGIPHDASTTWLQPAVVTDRADPKLAHIDGLNLSRAWMLEGIAQGLGRDDPRTLALMAAATAHRDAALPAVTGEHYEGGHWLGTFAVYLTSRATRPTRAIQ